MKSWWIIGGRLFQSTNKKCVARDGRVGVGLGASNLLFDSII